MTKTALIFPAENFQHMEAETIKLVLGEIVAKWTETHDVHIDDVKHYYCTKTHQYVFYFESITVAELLSKVS